MRHIQSFHLFESEDLITPFNVLAITRDSYDRPVNNKVATFIDRLLSKAFYEGFDKRHNHWSDSIIGSLSANTKRYLLELYNVLDRQGLVRVTAFRDEYGRVPQTPDEKIKTISGNHWGGFGRTAGADSATPMLPVPTPDVISDLMGKTMGEGDRTQMKELYKKLFGG